VSIDTTKIELFSRHIAMYREPHARDGYEALADRYASRIDTKAHNAFYERPATISLLPDVNGRRVLDAGCGPGKYAEILVERGAEVLGIDVSPSMVKLATERLGDRASFIVADMAEPLDFLQAGSFDVILAPLSLDYVENWTPVFHEFSRVLRPRGLFIFSITHPAADMAEDICENYFQVEPVVEVWTGFGNPPATVHRFRHPLGYTISTLLDGGFTLDQVLEPVPTGEFADVLPEDYALLSRRPGFLCIRAVNGTLRGEVDKQ
jgi:ubiquinone/menaquinone biosynthesis C-methylase UbiE